jgi:hypothetical protein
VFGALHDHLCTGIVEHVFIFTIMVLGMVLEANPTQVLRAPCRSSSEKLPHGTEKLLEASHSTS